MIVSAYVGMLSYFFFFNDTATTEIYTLSLHDALPISPSSESRSAARWSWGRVRRSASSSRRSARSEEHTSELQSRQYLVCRLLLEKKKKQQNKKLQKQRLKT